MNNYSYHKLFDFLIKEYDFKNDSELAKFLGLSRSTISKIRHNHIGFSANLILLTHKKTGMDVEDIEIMIDMQRMANESTFI